MPNINLSQSSQQRKAADSSYGFLDGHLVISLGILLVAFGAWGGVAWYNQSLTVQASALDADLAEKNKILADEKVGRLVDFQRRSDAVKQQLEQIELNKGVNIHAPETVLNQVQKYILPTVTLQSYSQVTEDKKLSLQASADDFQGVALQVMSFKAAFPSVVIAKVDRAEGGRVEFDVDISVK